MSSTSRIFAVSAAFFAVIGIVYWFVSYEPAGTLMFALWCAALLFAAVFVRVMARHSAVAGDDPTMRRDDAAGAWVGVFRSGSRWPLVLAAGLTVGLAGLLYGAWLLIPGALATIVALLGLMRETAAAWQGDTSGDGDARR